MADGVVTTIDPESRERARAERSPISYINIAFEEDSDEEEQEEVGRGSEGSLHGEEDSLIKVSPQR